MLKFFREIRVNLLNQGKTKRYLIYAFGEIILVMIGILLALQVNNWNENRKNKITEQAYMQGLKNDILDNKNELKRVIEKSLIAMEASDSTLSMSQLDNNSIPDTTFTRNMMQSLGFTIFLSNEGTINDIIGSGNLNMISDPEIRSAIASWEAEFKLIREFEKLGKEATTTYEKYLSENVDLYRYVKGGPTLSKKLRSQIIEDRVFRNSLDIIKLNFRSLNFLYKEKEVGLDSLLGKIEDNIK